MSYKHEFSLKDTNIVKGAAIMMLIFHHLFLDADRYAGFAIDFRPLTESSVNWLAYTLKICVTIFTFMSAYGMTLSLRKRTAENGMKPRICSQMVVHRLINLMSGFCLIYILVVLFGTFVMRDGRLGNLFLSNGVAGVWQILLDLFGLAELFSTPTYLATFWYMSLAIVVILIMPMLFCLYRRFGGIAVFGLGLALCALFPQQEHLCANLTTYLLGVITGMIAADNNWFVKLRDMRVGGSVALAKVIKFIVLTALICISVYLRYAARGKIQFSLWEGIVPILVVSWLFEFISPVKGLNSVFAFLGKHSMNIFLIHNFFRVVWFNDFTYGFKSIWLITLVLLLISLAVSVILELLKKWLGFYKLTAWAQKKAEQVLSGRPEQ